MLKERLAAADAVAQSLRPAEASIDIAAIEAARVVTVMMEARRKAGFDGRLGADALGHASRAASLMLQAQNALYEAHAALVPVAASVGLAGRIRMAGCEEPPENGPGALVRILFGEDRSAPQGSLQGVD